MNDIVCEKKAYNDKIITHSHDYAQLVIPLDGEMNVGLEHHCFTVGVDSIYLLPFGVEHSFCCHGRNQFLITNIPSYLLGLGKYKLCNGIKYELDERWKAIRFLLLDEFEHGTGSKDAISKLCYYFVPDMLNGKIPESVTYIREHYNENISVETLARIENYSIAYYSEWFKKSMGKLPMVYLHELRIERAKELLRSTNLNIMQVSREVGYTYESSFTKRFTIAEKISPKAYRIKNR